MGDAATRAPVGAAPVMPATPRSVAGFVTPKPMCHRKTFTRVAWAVVLLLCLAGSGVLAAAAYEVYSIQEGDTLATIAARFGVEESAIAEFNGLAPGAKLEPGESLMIPIARDAAAGRTAQEAFAAEEKQARDVEAAELTIKPAAQARSGPVVGYLGVTVQDAVAVADPRGDERLCTIPRGTNVCVSCQYGEHYGILMSDGAVAWVPKQDLGVQAVELVAGIEVPAGVNGRTAIVEAAFRYYGLPYRYGGVPPGPTDCSAFVQTVFRDRGVHLPRTAAAQFNVGYGVALDQLAIGDRLYFVNSEGYIGHTGIYIGNGQFIHASSRRGYVGIDTLRSGFYRHRLVGARRP